jgi:hypothetical protein
MQEPMSSRAQYVALNAGNVEQRFLDYPRAIADEDVGRIRNQAVAAGWSWVEEPVGYYLKVLPSAGGGLRRIDTPEGWPFAVADLLASSEVSRWQAEHPNRLVRTFTGSAFSPVFERSLEEDGVEDWRRLTRSLVLERGDPAWSSAPWWRAAMAADGTYTHGLTPPDDRDAIAEAMLGRDLLSRVLGEMRDQGDGEGAEDVAGLVDWLTSDETTGCWILGWALA